MSSRCLQSNECHNYIPRVRVVDSCDRDVGKKKSDPRICLLDYRKAHDSVNGMVSVYRGEISAWD